MKSRWTKRIAVTAGLLALILALSLSMPARAVEFTHEGVVPAGQVVDDDLFINADEAVIDGTVNGDLFISSETAQVSGTVNGNLMVYSAAFILDGTVTGSVVFAGQGAEINGEVNGTVYAASNTIRFTPTARIGRNVFYAGYALEAQPGSEIGRDIYAAVYQATIDCQSVRNLNISASAVTIGGNVTGDVVLDVSEPGKKDGLVAAINDALPPLPGIPPIPMLPPGLVITPETSIGGTVSYTSPVDQSAAIRATPAAGVTFTQKIDKEIQVDEQTQQELVAAWFGSWFQELATLLILGGLTAALLPALLQRCSAQARLRPHINAGKGLLVLVAGFGLSVLAFVTVIILSLLVSIVSLGGLSRAILGIGLSGLATAFSVFLLTVSYGSKLVLAQLAGQSVLNRFLPAFGEHRYWPLIVGILLYMLLRLIPLVGALVAIIATLVGLGAIWLTLRRHKDEYYLSAQPVEAAA